MDKNCCSLCKLSECERVAVLTAKRSPVLEVAAETVAEEPRPSTWPLVHLMFGSFGWCVERVVCGLNKVLKRLVIWLGGKSVGGIIWAAF